MGGTVAIDQYRSNSWHGSVSSEAQSFHTQFPEGGHMLMYPGNTFAPPMVEPTAWPDLYPVYPCPVLAVSDSVPNASTGQADLTLPSAQLGTSRHLHVPPQSAGPHARSDSRASAGSATPSEASSSSTSKSDVY